MLLSNPFMVDPRVHKEAKALVEAGNTVTVIVWDRKKEYESEATIDNINLIRIHDTLPMRFLKKDLFKNPLWWRHAYKKALKLHQKQKFDVVHCHDLDTLQAGVWFKRRTGCKLVYDAHEIFGYMIEESMPKIICRYAFRLEKNLVKSVDYLITVDEPFQQYFETIAECPITIVMNCKDLIYQTYEPAKNDCFTLIYIGIMTKGRFFPEIIDTIKEIKNVQLILAGKKEALYNQMKTYVKDIDNITFLGTIPSNEIIPRTHKADAVFVLVDPTSLQHKKTVFNKQFEAMVCGRPIIVTKDTYAAEMTEKLSCGLCVEYSNESVKNAITELRDNPGLVETLGKNGFIAAKERYNWAYEKNNLLQVYDAL
jgi:glycosyltransferase involved in cell wall biosynthesis